MLVPAADLASRFAPSRSSRSTPLAFGSPDICAGCSAAMARRYSSSATNGGIFNDRAVGEALAAHGVIPLNSSAANPPYNGAIERPNRQIERDLISLLGAPPS